MRHGDGGTSMRAAAGSLGARRSRSVRPTLVVACVIALAAGACSGGSGTHSASKKESPAARDNDRVIDPEHQGEGDKGEGDKGEGPEAHGLDLHLHQDAHG